MNERTTDRRLLFAAAPLVVGALVLAFVPPIAQPESFHDFADRRTFFGLPNFFDVVTNAPFLFIGILILRKSARTAMPRDLRRAYGALALALVGTACGSSWYHLAPSTPALVFDRIPLAMLFASIFAVIIRARTRRPFPLPALVASLGAAAASVLWWAATERRGHGDLRWYLLVQFGGMAMIALVLALYRKERGSPRPFIRALALYAIALALQEFDKPVFRQIGGTLSGHSLKHLFAAAATICFLTALDRPEDLADDRT